MSTEPTSPAEPRPTTDQPTTEIAARGRTDPWAAAAEHPDPDRPFTSARAPRQFEPTHVQRLRNLVDEENAYSR